MAFPLHKPLQHLCGQRFNSVSLKWYLVVPPYHKPPLHRLLSPHLNLLFPKPFPVGSFNLRALPPLLLARVILKRHSSLPHQLIPQVPCLSSIKFLKHQVARFSQPTLPRIFPHPVQPPLPSFHRAPLVRQTCLMVVLCLRTTRFRSNSQKTSSVSPPALPPIMKRRTKIMT